MAENLEQITAQNDVLPGIPSVNDKFKFQFSLAQLEIFSFFEIVSMSLEKSAFALLSHLNPENQKNIPDYITTSMGLVGGAVLYVVLKLLTRNDYKAEPPVQGASVYRAELISRIEKISEEDPQFAANLVAEELKDKIWSNYRNLRIDGVRGDDISYGGYSVFSLSRRETKGFFGNFFLGDYKKTPIADVDVDTLKIQLFCDDSLVRASAEHISSLSRGVVKVA